MRDSPPFHANEHAAFALEQTFRAGYDRGFYSSGNYFPDESWARYAQGIEAQSAKTAGLGPQDESPVT